MTGQPAYAATDLIEWASRVLTNQGMDADKAITVAAILVEGDLLGHDTHGLQLLGPYVGKLIEGTMSGTGGIDVISDRPAAMLWDGNRLPGPWLTAEAVAIAAGRARANGTASIVIRRSGHIGCLAAYLEAPARDGLMVEIHSSDPAVASVAPFGGTGAVFTPNPIAFGIPAGGDPIMIDISTSITTNGMSGRLKAAGKTFPGRWLLDSAGKPTDDPAVFDDDPPGTIQLLGGLDAGHKGYGLTLWVEAMTGGLAGYGRPDGVDGWGATVMVRVTDPGAFGGTEAFNRQLDWLIAACQASPPVTPNQPVRLPGHRGLERKRASLETGLRLNPLVQDAIENVASKFEQPLPAPLEV